MLDDEVDPRELPGSRGHQNNRHADNGNPEFFRDQYPRDYCQREKVRDQGNVSFGSRQDDSMANTVHSFGPSWRHGWAVGPPVAGPLGSAAGAFPRVKLRSAPW